MTSKMSTTNTARQQPNSRAVTTRTISSSGGSSSSLVSTGSATALNEHHSTNTPERSNKRLDDIQDHREQQIQQRQREANEAKARKLQMYDNMAKSGHAGDTKALDINTYRGKSSGSLLLSGAAVQKVDYVEETIRERVRRSEQQKKRLLAAFDYAAKTQPAGTVRDVDFGSFKDVDVSAFESDKPAGTATFQMSNGVPNVAKPSSSTPSTPVIQLNKAPNFSQAEPHVDAYERALRQRQRECDERKARTLAAYDAIARCGVAGPKIVVREELEQMDLPAEQPPKPKFSCTSSFSGGYAKI